MGAGWTLSLGLKLRATGVWTGVPRVCVLAGSADEGGQAGAPGETKGPADRRAHAMGTSPREGVPRGQKGPLHCPPDSNLKPTWKSPRLGVSGCGHALSIRRGAPRRARASVSTSRGLAPPDCTSRVPSRCGLRFPCCPPPPPPPVSFYGDGAILKLLGAIKIKPESHIWASGETTVETWNAKAIYTAREHLGKKLTTGF